MITYNVVLDDCLWTIAARYLGNGLRWTEIADLNSISRDNPIIYVGQVLQIDDNGTSTPQTPNVTYRVNIAYFGLQAGTESAVFAAWDWERSNTESYQVVWYYDTGDGLWFIGNDSTEKKKQSIYRAPANALAVKLTVKPIAEKHKVNKEDVVYWTAEWSTERSYYFSENPPSAPPAPKVDIDSYTLTAQLEKLDINATSVQYEIVQDNAVVFHTGEAIIMTGSASYACTVAAGSIYKVRCRGVRDRRIGAWSPYSSNVGTIPPATAGITACRAGSETSIYLAWEPVSNATSYEIEYATSRTSFDRSNDTTTVSKITFTHYEITGLETGQVYFLRVRAVNSVGQSAPSGIASVVIGKKPAAPTTWASTTTAVAGEALTLYWVHNTGDGSRQKYAEVELYIDGVKETCTIRPDETEAEEDEENYSYPINTAKFTEGTQIQWRVRTAGITLVYGDWSMQRQVDIYAPPTLALKVADEKGVAIETLGAFPFYVSALAKPDTQVPTGYYLRITADQSYETVNSVGNKRTVSKGEHVYSRYFDGAYSLNAALSAYNIDLANNISYTVTCVVSMNSGLTAEATSSFTVAWTGMEYPPNAEIGINRAALAAYIRPYCEDEKGQLIGGVMLSVYRREFDGEFTEIIKNINNGKGTFVTDPHPALDFARYRIVATDQLTGAVSYYDMPGYPIKEKAVILQWNDYWSNFDATGEDAIAQQPRSGELVRLPYNIDVADSHEKDVALAEYAGRKHPVSYYGTQLGVTTTWNVEIAKKDKETLYALRRLAIWGGDVYVREPSGSGYWANISVSFSQTHGELTIPVTFDIVRVEGGV